MEPMSKQKIQQIQSEIIEQLTDSQSELEAIAHSTKPLMHRWQSFIGIILPVQLSVIAQHGYAADQQGLSQFNQALMNLSKEDEDIKQQNHQKWQYLLKTAFNLDTIATISLQEAKALVNDLHEATVSEAFLLKVESLISELPEDATMTSKRQAILELLLPMHMDVIHAHGFKGEAGYIQMQSALLDYYADLEIIQKSTTAQHVLFKRAGL